MHNPYRSQRERAAFEAGYAARRADAKAAKPATLTRADIEAMGRTEINERWPEVQASLAAGMPTETPEETEPDA
jgi:hypothetical protein